ncbi:MAG: hypothetical protein BAJALOKI3v1_50086 [Promethearchaeota archaeon]|nr:MAG: hypothetical protein BAJALOKI3v1_50086 [Candidatus Lokiarchaeota archaeon]
MSIANCNVYRVYRCCNCKAEIGINQLASDDWFKNCPMCKQDELIIKSAKLSINTIVDGQTPQTIGSLADKNRDIKLKNGEIKEKKKPPRPWWRKSDKINFDILKNPRRYIETGKT